MVIGAVAALLGGCGDSSEAQSTSAEGANQIDASAEPTIAATEKLDAFPAKYRGYWDGPDTGEYRCSDLSYSILSVEGNELGYYESAFQPSEIEAISANELTSSGTMVGADEDYHETAKLKLSPDGKRLTITIGDYEPYEYTKCEGGLRDVEVSIVPAVFHGKWAWQDPKNCNVEPFNDLIVSGREVILGGRKGEVTGMTVVDTGSVSLNYTNAEGGDQIMYLAMIDDGKRIAYGEPGATGTIFAKCP